MWMNCILWLATGAQIMLGVPGEPVTLRGLSGEFQIDFADGTKSMAWAAGEWTRWECDHYVKPEPDDNKLHEVWGFDGWICRGPREAVCERVEK